MQIRSTEELYFPSEVPDSDWEGDGKEKCLRQPRKVSYTVRISSANRILIIF